MGIAEIELSLLVRQGLSERVPNLQTLKAESTAWTATQTTNQHGVDWQFATGDARVKLKRLYPTYIP
ncbi:hypothetical protein [Salisaeta longa]|uniref:hypothetical protein n=1 Tax=Salisaeta longa TaxID=503170 RepID=UPI000400F3D0|nr:hypothetical protein [Salisaeta longa]